MTQIGEIVKTLLLVGGGLTGLLLLLLALPHSKLRDFLMPIISWLFVLACGAYVISPIDVLPEMALGPFGLVDDVGALIAGIVAARAAMKAGKARQLN
jgi:uncharacterized membrane protein YkvA (DUF1232 family)